jgi:hypothetical protein
MIALTGLFANPSTATPNQSATNVADTDTKSAKAMPAHQPGILRIFVNVVSPLDGKRRMIPQIPAYWRFLVATLTGRINGSFVN